MRAHVIPRLGARNVSDVTSLDIRRLLIDVAEPSNARASGGPVISNRVRAMVATLFRYAVAKAVIPASPVEDVERIASERPRDRALSEIEIRAFLAVLTSAPTTPTIRLALLGEYFHPFRNVVHEPPPERQPATDAAESALLLLFLRRYVTWCARRRRFAAMNGAARLHANIVSASPP